ncbi:MAG: hypothetical protein AAF316_00305 [Cyanobacteria bacterium P01_A01_bin.80]
MLIDYRHYKKRVLKAYKSTGIKNSQALFLVFGTMAVLASYPSFNAHQARIEADKADIDQKTLERRILQRQLDSEKEKAIIAEQRYKSCLPVVGENFKNGTHYFAGIQEGSLIQDRITGNTLPSGTIICDGFGNTASINSDGKATNFAYTGDRDVIQKRLKRFKASQFSQPIISTGKE